jgi:predicted nucleic acid-binding protein
VTRLEIGYSARSGASLRTETTRPPISLMPLELVAAIAEIAGLTILHVNADFETIARLTGQPLQRLVT